MFPLFAMNNFDCNLLNTTIYHCILQYIYLLLILPLKTYCTDNLLKIKLKEKKIIKQKQEKLHVMSKSMLILTINLRVFLSCPSENGNE